MLAVLTLIPTSNLTPWWRGRSLGNLSFFSTTFFLIIVNSLRVQILPLFYFGKLRSFPQKTSFTSSEHLSHYSKLSSLLSRRLPQLTQGCLSWFIWKIQCQTTSAMFFSLSQRVPLQIRTVLSSYQNLSGTSRRKSKK